MTILTTLLGNLTVGAARSLNNKHATAAAIANAKANAKKGGTGCTPCQARAQIHAAQQGLGIKGWYKMP